MGSPPLFDYTKLDSWKVNMTRHLKTLGHLVYQAITIETLPNTSKHKKANALALKTLRASFDNDLVLVFDRFDSAFAVWSILTTPELPRIINNVRRYRRDVSEEHGFVVYGNDSHEVQPTLK